MSLNKRLIGMFDREKNTTLNYPETFPDVSWALKKTNVIINI